MKKTFKDFQQDLLLFLVRPLVYVWMFFDSKSKVIKSKDVSFMRKEPYVLLANHTFLFDVIHVPLRLWKVPFIIASQTLFTKQPAKFFVTQVAHVIPKSKGKSDPLSIMKIFSAVKRGYPILIFPEGDTTFYGETNYIEESTMKLIKKLKLDVITCNVKGGYHSKPRWATGKRKNRRIVLDYQLTIPKDKLKEMTLEEINETVKKALYHNAYEYQREHMIPHPGSKLAEGIEDVLYICPECESVNSFYSYGNHFQCQVCHHESEMDQYGFIQDAKFDNLIDWNHYQRGFQDKLRQSRIESTGMLSYLRVEDDSHDPVGEVTMIYENGNLYFHGSLEETIPISEITNATVTVRRDFGFFYQNRHYSVKLDHYAQAFLRIVQEKY